MTSREGRSINKRGEQQCIEKRRNEGRGGRREKGKGIGEKMEHEIKGRKREEHISGKVREQKVIGKKRGKRKGVRK